MSGIDWGVVVLAGFGIAALVAAGIWFWLGTMR